MKRVIGLSMILLTLGCNSMPGVTRTGEVKDIVIGDTLSSTELVVSPGDEVRWVNKRTAAVRVVFLDPITDKQLSCKENFGGWMTRSDTAELDTNETASVCFRDPGYVRYTVRMKSAMPIPETNVSGVVKVGATSGDVRPTKAKANTVTAGANTAPVGSNTPPAGSNTAPAGSDTTPAGANTAPIGSNTTTAASNTTPAGSTVTTTVTTVTSPPSR